MLFNDYFSYNLSALLNKYHDQLIFSKGQAVTLLYTLFGEDGPSQMALEDNTMFGTEPDTIILQPSDAVSTAKLVPSMMNHKGMVYLRTLRPKTPVIYKVEDKIKIGGSKV